jgi:hypothetical protein
VSLSPRFFLSVLCFHLCSSHTALMCFRHVVLDVSCRNLPDVNWHASPTVVVFSRDPQTEQITLVGQTEVLAEGPHPAFQSPIKFEVNNNHNALTFHYVCTYGTLFHRHDTMLSPFSHNLHRRS